MKKTFGILFFVGIFSILTGCIFINDDGNEKFDCPSVTDDVTWTSYGRFEMRKSGMDSTARKIISKCGWHVFRGHNGGVGDTLQVTSPNEEVVLVWAYNSFYGFRLIRGWEGMTHRYAIMGDSNNLFSVLHPEFSFKSSRFAVYLDKNTQVKAYFDQYGALNELLVGYYFRY